MDILFALLWFVAIILMIVGLIKPKLVIRWGEDDSKNRKSVLKYYGISSLAFFILFFIFLDAPKDSSDEIEPSVIAEDIEEEKEVFKLLASDTSLVKTNYVDLTSEEKSRFDVIVNNFDDLSKEEQDSIKSDVDRLREQEDQYLEEQARIQAEKAEKEAEAKAIAEKEKYNSGITRNDLARDKDGLIGSYVKFKGKILQVMQGDGYTQYRMAVNNDYDQIILIEIQDYKLDSNILEDDVITIEGQSVGNITYDTIMGGAMTIPGVSVDNFYF